LASPWRRTVVLFTLPVSELSTFDVGKGPFVQRRATGTPIASKWDQYDAATPRGIEELFRLLVPDPSVIPWSGMARSGRSTLYRLSDAFVVALLAIDAEFRRLDAAEVEVKGRRAKDEQALRVLAPITEVAERWLDRSTWPLGMTAGGVQTILIALIGLTKADRDEAALMWHGHGVPMRSVTSRRRPDGTREIEIQ
jgi:hypothetical protein